MSNQNDKIAQPSWEEELSPGPLANKGKQQVLWLSKARASSKKDRTLYWVKVTRQKGAKIQIMKVHLPGQLHVT